jgi:hypothetical protein
MRSATKLPALPGWLPLIPRAGLWLRVWSCDAPIERDEVERFVRLFREVWAGVFASDRRAILRHWRKLLARAARGYARARAAKGNPDGPRVPCVIPFIELCRKEWPRGQRNIQAQTGLDAQTLTFEASRLLRRDAGARAVIAHELGHVRLIAAGCDPVLMRPPTANGVDYILSPVEVSANVLAAAWGFEPADHHRVEKRWIEGAIRLNPSHPTAVWLRRRLARH